MAPLRALRAGRAVFTDAANRLRTATEQFRRPEGAALIVELCAGDDELFAQQRRCLVALETAGASAPSPLTLMTSPRPWPAAAPVVIPMFVDASDARIAKWVPVLEELGWGWVALVADVAAARARWSGAGALIGASHPEDAAPHLTWCLDSVPADALVRVTLRPGWAPPTGLCHAVSLHSALLPHHMAVLVSPDSTIASRRMAMIRAGRLANRVAARLPGR